MTRVPLVASHPGRIWLWSLILCMIFGANSMVLSQDEPEASLRILVQKFFAAYQKKDLDALMSIWSTQSPDLASARKNFQQTFSLNDKIEFKIVDIQKVSIERRKASMRLIVELSASDAKTGKPSTDFGRSNRTFHFVEESEGWKVWKYAMSEEELALALAQADTDVERTAMLEAAKELQTVELVRALLAQGRRLQEDKDQYQRALTVCRLALTFAEQLGDKTLIARALAHAGVAYKLQGDSTRALALFQRSLNVSTELGDKLGSARMLGMLGAFYYQENDYQQALASYLKGLRLSEELDNKWAIYGFLNGLGATYSEQGDYGEALAYHEKNLKIIEELGDKSLLAGCLRNIGVCYDSQANYSRALEYYQKGLKLDEERADKSGIARSLNNIGVVYRLQGDFTQALDYLHRSLKIKEELRNDEDIASALGNIGEILIGRGDYTQALEYVQKGLILSEALGDQKGKAQALSSLGLLRTAEGNYAAALDYLQRALKLNQAMGDKANTAASLNSLGDVHFLLGRYAEAAELFDQSARLAKQINLGELVWLSNALSGRAHHAMNQPERARQCFLTAIDTIEELRGQVGGGEQDRQRSFENRLLPYRGMVGLSVEQKNEADALMYAERAKSRVLLDVLQIGRINITGAMTREEQEREHELRAQTVSLNVQLNREKQQQRPDNAGIGELEARLQKARLAHEAFQTGMYAAHPELKLQRGRMQPITMDQISSLIREAGTALLEFEVLEDKTFLFVATSKPGSAQARVDLKIYILPIKQKELAELTQRFGQSLAERRLTVQELGTRLYDSLLKPARTQLQGIRSLIIVPDDVLWRLPFQALQPSNGRYVIEDYSVSYAPSLTVLREMMRQPMKASTSRALAMLLAFGNPSVGVETVEHAKALVRDGRLEPLPEAEREVKLLGQLYGPDQSRIYTGLDAQEERFKAEAGNYRIIHLATHGILNNASPMYSQLVLSRSQTNGREDGLLEAWEIMNMDLKADLVVLSACETARGRVGAGEGIIGLSWALFVAGAPTTVVTQWKVDSGSSTELMLEFHRQLKINLQRKGTLDSAAALRQAALKLLRSKRYDHPFYWAPFVVIGNGMGGRTVQN